MPRIARFTHRVFPLVEYTMRKVAAAVIVAAVSAAALSAVEAASQTSTESRPTAIQAETRIAVHGSVTSLAPWGNDSGASENVTFVAKASFSCVSNSMTQPPDYIAGRLDRPFPREGRVGSTAGEGVPWNGAAS
jgi:hypothetical protein